MHLVGVDVGGTFTDLVLSDPEGGETYTHKIPTSGDDPSEAVIRGVNEICVVAGIEPSEVGYVFHGTTTATNAILEHKGAEVGLLTTEGFRDVVHIGRHQRPQNYSIMQEIPWQDRSLVKRRHRKVVPERLAPPRGEVLTPLDEGAVREAAREFKETGVEAVAVCFLFSYLNPAHEERAREILEEEMPEAFVTTSSSIFPQFREFERFTTAAINAFVGPKVGRYVRNLRSGLKQGGVRADVHIMRSNGGVSPSEVAAESPVTLLLSGPAAGILGGAYSGEVSGKRNLITFDVGGTSADIGIVTGRGFEEAGARDTWIAGFPVMVPMIDVSTIGAGGGSVAYVDEGGAFRVGPRSAGAVPGPACYGKGGTEPTVTDAHAVLGVLDPEHFLGGNMPLYPERAFDAVGRLAEKLGMGVREAADGVLRILNNSMANATRAVTIQKGHDPRGFSLVAFGGAGPLHAVEVARILGVREIIVPAYPGINSAIGLLTTDLKYDAIATQFTLSTAPDLERLNADLERLEGDVHAQLRSDGVADEDIEVLRGVDCRYVGQGYELRVPLPEGEINEENVQRVWEGMHDLRRQEYGHAFPGNPVEMVNLRVSGVGKTPKMRAVSLSGERGIEEARLKEGEVYFRHGGSLQPFSTTFYERARLPVGERIEGPAVILQNDTTTLLPLDAGCVLEEGGNLVVDLKGE